MNTRILSAFIAVAIAGSVFAQDTSPPPPVSGTGAPHLSGTLPLLPPGCLRNASIAPPPPPPPSPLDTAYVQALGLSSVQASKVSQVFEQQALQAQHLDVQRRDLDATTCRNLRNIIGDQGMARLTAMTPPPPPRAPGDAPPPPPPAPMQRH